MTPGAKVFLTLAGVGAAIGTVLLFSSKSASAQPGQPKQPAPGSNVPPDVVVPEPGAAPAPPPQGGGVPTASFPPLPPIPPLPGPVPPIPPLQAPPSPQGAPPGVSVPPGITQTLPNPLGGAPLGTFDPATGNVFGPNGTIIGTFNPTTGLFTGPGGVQIPIPGFGGAAPPTPTQVVPPPVSAVPAAPAAPPSPGVTVQLPSGPVTIPLPAPVAQSTPPGPAGGTTVSADTAAMVAGLLTAEASPGWNKVDPLVRAWQKTKGLTADGKFGPQTALTAAKELGTVPLIRFWPLGSTKAKLLASYQDALLALASQSADPARAAQLQHSAQREQAIAFSTKGALPAVPPADQVQIAQVA